MDWWIYLAIITGILAPLIYTLFWNLRNQKKVKKLLKKKQSNALYANKFPVNYSKSERKWTFVVISFLLLMSILSGLLVFYGHIQAAHLLVLLTLIIWKILILLGNRIGR